MAPKNSCTWCIKNKKACRWATMLVGGDEVLQNMCHTCAYGSWKKQDGPKSRGYAECDKPSTTDEERSYSGQLRAQVRADYKQLQSQLKSTPGYESGEIVDRSTTSASNSTQWSLAQDNQDFYDDFKENLLGPGHCPEDRDASLQALDRIMNSAGLTDEERHCELVAECERFNNLRERRWMERDSEACKNMERIWKSLDPGFELPVPLNEG